MKTMTKFAVCLSLVAAPFCRASAAGQTNSNSVAVAFPVEFDDIVNKLDAMLEEVGSGDWKGAFSRELSRLEEVEPESFRMKAMDRVVGLIFKTRPNGWKTKFVDERCSWLGAAIHHHFSGDRNILTRWKYKAEMLFSMKRERSLYLDAKDINAARKDKKIREQIRAEQEAYVEKHIKGRPRVYSIQMPRFATEKRIIARWEYSRSLERHIANFEREFDSLSGTVKADFDILAKERRNDMVRCLERGLGRKPKWYPPIEELDAGAVKARLAQDLREDYNLAEQELYAMPGRIANVTDVATHEMLLTNTISLFMDSGCWPTDRSGVVNTRMHLFDRLVWQSRGRLGLPLAWKLRMGMLKTLEVELDGCTNMSGCDMPTNACDIVAVVRAASLSELRGWVSSPDKYKPACADANQWRRAVETQFQIAIWRESYFENMLKMDYEWMPSDERTKLLKEVEAVLGRPPKWVSAEK